MKATRSRGLNHTVDMRSDLEQPLREQRRRERSRSQSHDDVPLPPPPPINMHIENHDCIVLHSVPSFREIDSGELGSDAPRDILSQFTNLNSFHPRNPPILEDEDEDATSRRPAQRAEAPLRGFAKAAYRHKAGTISNGYV